VFATAEHGNQDQAKSQVLFLLPAVDYATVILFPRQETYYYCLHRFDGTCAKERRWAQTDTCCCAYGYAVEGGK